VKSFHGLVKKIASAAEVAQATTERSDEEEHAAPK
jgi:hypothetical protein